jgi:hypothetical protein
MSVSAPRLRISGQVIVWTSLLTGTLDGLAAVINQYIVVRFFPANPGHPGVPHPERIFQFIASTVFGPITMLKVSYAWYGLVFHYLIAYCFTSFFLILYPRLPLLRANWWVVGAGYGAFIWTVMNVVVLPLVVGNTPIQKWAYTPAGALLAAAILMVAIGLPTAFIAQKTVRSDPV